jgi:hypothetical protein
VSNLMLVCFKYKTDTYLSMKCPALSIEVPSFRYSKFLGMIISPFSSDDRYSNLCLTHLCNVCKAMLPLGGFM